MPDGVFIPSPLREAGGHLRNAFAVPLESLSKSQFAQAWSSLAYLFPNLHPDGWDDADENWPRVLRRFAAEAWRRAEAGEVSDNELYPADAQWSGLYDRMFPHTAEEIERRLALASESARQTLTTAG